MPGYIKKLQLFLRLASLKLAFGITLFKLNFAFLSEPGLYIT